MWVVEDILPEGCYILSARPKVGKSWLSLQVSLAVALGERTLGKNVVKGKAIYLALEDNQRRLQSRLEQLKPDGYSTENLLLFTQWPSFDNNGIEELINLILKEEPKLVVIDTLAKVRAASRSTHVYENDYKTLAPLTAIANKYRLCILIVTHNRKGKSENDALEQVSGSLGLTGAVDGALVIDGIRTDKQYKLSLIGRDIPTDDELAIARESNGEWHILGNASQVFVSEERKAILELLRLNPEGLKPKEISDILEKKSGATRKLLTTMAASLQVVNDKGIYKHPSPIGISTNISSISNSGNNGNNI
jgi:predicted ATP-dependent serine protease